ncbi:MAG: 50S ribosomal protein L9 [Candidatus Latescibacteria bacterium]|nr:50S ribosomal protein L9 [Candidatus Latescibacterota bacterium]
MKIILRDNVSNLGDAGEVVEVKAGYARNFLIPRQMAYRASPAGMKTWEQESKARQMMLAKENQESNSLKATLETDSVTIGVTVGEDYQIFGSVTNRQIADALVAKNYQIDRRQIIINTPIRALDVHEVEVNLGHGVHAVLKVWVVQESGLAVASTDSDSAAEPDTEAQAEIVEVAAEPEESADAPDADEAEVSDLE